MILVDTSIWIDHLRAKDTILLDLLMQERVVIHDFIIGELAMGNLSPRASVLLDLRDLPKALVATDEEVLSFVDRHALFGRGVGYIDAHLLASCLLTSGTLLWTRDRRLSEMAGALSLAASHVQ